MERSIWSGTRLASCSGRREGNSVVPAAPSLRPSAEWKRLRRGGSSARLKSCPSEDGYRKMLLMASGKSEGHEFPRAARAGAWRRLQPPGWACRRRTSGSPRGAGRGGRGRGCGGCSRGGRGSRRGRGGGGLAELKASLPEGVRGAEAVGEASLDALHGAFERDALRGEDQVNVVGHEDEGVELVEAFLTPPGKERPSGTPIRGGSVGGCRGRARRGGRPGRAGGVGRWAR